MATNFDLGLSRIQHLAGEVDYWYWQDHMVVVPDGPGAFAVNLRLPAQSTLDRQLRDSGVFCMGVINIMRRANRMIVPTRGDSRYDGGTWAAYGFWWNYWRTFSRNIFIPRGSLIFRVPKWKNGVMVDQGHVGVLTRAQNLASQQDGILLHSHPAVGGLAHTRLGASHAGFYYDLWLPPEDWINHDNPASKF